MATDYKAKIILGWSTLHFAEETESWESVETLLSGGSSTRDLVTTKRKLKDPLRAPTVARELCRRGCLKLLRFALSENPELVRMRLEMSRTLLHVATQSGSLVAVRCLMDYPVDVNASDERGMTPLLEAAAHCDAHVLMLLLQAGADAHAKDIDGRTALHYAASSGSASSIRNLLDYPVDVNASDGRGATPLHEAAARCDAHMLLMLLLKAGADANAKDADGRTALHYAATGGSAAGIKILLSEGLAPDVESAIGCSPLHEAASSSNHHCVELLLNAGADLNMATNSGWTALHWAASKGTVRSLRILLENGIPVGSKTHQDETPLHLAAERGHSDMVTILVNHGADVEAVDSDGRTPAKRAADRLQQQQEEEEEVSAAASIIAAESKKEAAEETKKRRRQRKHGKSSQVTASSAKANTDLQTSPHSEMLQGDDAQPYFDEVEGSECSYQSVSEISGQRFSDTGSDVEEECQVETTSGRTPTGKKPQSLFSVETNQGQGHTSRGKHHGRGHGYIRGHKSGWRGGGRGHSREEKPERHVFREYTPPHGKAQYAGNVEREEHHPRRHHHHQVKEGEARREYNTQSNREYNTQRNREYNTQSNREYNTQSNREYNTQSNREYNTQSNTRDTKRKEHSYAAGEDNRKKHPFSKDRQKQSGDRQVIQTVVPNSRTGDLESQEAYGSTDNINHQESRIGGTFLDELRYLQEKLAIVGADTTQPPKSKQNQYRTPKPEF